MSELPARKRPLRAVRRLDHDAVDVRLDASLLDYGRVSREAGLTSEEAVERLRGLLDAGSEQTKRGLQVPRVPPRLIVVIAGAMAVAGLLWLAAGLVASSPAGGEDQTVFDTPPSTPVGVGGFAEILVATYLGQAGEGTETVLEPFLTQPVELFGLAPGRLYVQNVAAMGVEPTQGGWSVDVAAQVLRRIEGGYGEPVLQHYRVEVLRGDRYQASVVPKQIAVP